MKPTIVLGIETSCDETSIAVVKETKVLSHVTASQIKRHEVYGGVFPELASRLHTENIGYVLQTALKESKVALEDLSAIAVTRGPGLIGALHIGLQSAKMLAATLNIPLIGVHHHAAHLEAVRFVQPIVYPALGLIVSGGHTELVYLPKPLRYELIGQTQDDAIGESYDKVARMMGLGYPGGPIIDQLAQTGKRQYTLPLPKATGRFDFSYSGLKTAVQNLLQKEQQAKRLINQPNLAFDFQRLVIQTLIDKLQLALQSFPVKSVVFGGGVSLNSELRKQAIILSKQTNLPFMFAPPWACTDNGAMIALLGGEMLKVGMVDSLELGVDPSWEIQASSQK